MTLAELIEILGGNLAQGSAATVLQGVNSSALAGPAELTFAEDEASAVAALASNAGAVVLRPGAVDTFTSGKCVIEDKQPRLWFARAARLLAPALPCAGVHPAAVVEPEVVLGTGVTIAAHAVVQAYAAREPDERRDIWLLMSERFAPDGQELQSARDEHEAAVGTLDEG